MAPTRWLPFLALLYRLLSSALCSQTRTDRSRSSPKRAKLLSAAPSIHMRKELSEWRVCSRASADWLIRSRRRHPVMSDFDIDYLLLLHFLSLSLSLLPPSLQLNDAQQLEQAEQMLLDRLHRAQLEQRKAFQELEEALRMSVSPTFISRRRGGRSIAGTQTRYCHSLFVT